MSGVTAGLTAGFSTLQQLQQDMRAPRSATSEEQLAQIKATLEAQRARFDQRRFKPPDLFKDSTAAFQLRNRLQQALNRLDSAETRERAVVEIRRIIDQNRSEEALKVEIGCLADFGKSKSPKARELEAGLIGFLAETYGKKLSDSSISPLHYYMRLMDLCLAFFKDLHRNVQEAAATSLCQLYTHSLPKEDMKLIFDVVYDPLYSILLSGVDVKAQQGASIALFKWISTVTDSNQIDLLTELVPKVLYLFIKLRPEFPELISALGLMLETIGFREFVPELPPFLSKVIQYLRARSQGSFSLKIEACKLLKLLGVRLQKVIDILIGFSTQEVIDALTDTKADKVPIVQASAREALEQWQLLARMQVRVEEDKMQRETLVGEELIKHRTGLAELPRLVKERTALELPVLTTGKNEQFSDFKKMREALKRKKETKSVPVREPVSYQWGTFKPKFLLKGTGHYTSIPVAAADAPQPVLTTSSAAQPFVPLQPSEPAALNRDLLRAIIKTAPQKRPATATGIISRVRETSIDPPEPPAQENVEELNQQIKEIEDKAADIKRNMAQYRAKTAQKVMETMVETRQSRPSPVQPDPPIDTDTGKDGVTQIWLRALEKFSQGDLNAAFTILLEAGDDVYLMRLMHKSGVCLDQLNPKVTAQVMQRLGLLLGGWIIPEATMQWCEEAARIGLWQQLEPDTQAGIVEDVQAFLRADGVNEQAQQLLSVLEVPSRLN